MKNKLILPQSNSLIQLLGQILATFGNDLNLERIEQDKIILDHPFILYASKPRFERCEHLWVSNCNALVLERD